MVQVYESYRYFYICMNLRVPEHWLQFSQFKNVHILHGSTELRLTGAFWIFKHKTLTKQLLTNIGFSGCHI